MDNDGEYVYDLLLNKLNKHPLRCLPSIEYWYELFDFALNVFKEAGKCYDAGANEACAVMCRNAIDSFLLLATESRIIRDQKYIDDDGTLVEWTYDTHYVHDEDILKILNEEKNKAVSWKLVKEKILKSSILDKDDIKQIEHSIRKKGNFSAHLIEAQKKENIRWHREHKDELDQILLDLEAKKTPNWKVMEHSDKKTWTFHEEANKILTLTSTFLEKIVVNYYSSGATIKEVHYYRSIEDDGSD